MFICSYKLKNAQTLNFLVFPLVIALPLFYSQIHNETVIFFLLNNKSVCLHRLWIYILPSHHVKIALSNHSPLYLTGLVKYFKSHFRNQDNFILSAIRRMTMRHISDATMILLLGKYVTKHDNIFS